MEKNIRTFHTKHFARLNRIKLKPKRTKPRDLENKYKSTTLT
jgi:hypothetical protein